jgi:orotidine-5'-phosphate decarboxylase
MGSDTLQPFLLRHDKGVVILCKTSNPGSGELQTLQVEGQTLYERIAHHAQHDWNTQQNILLVVGATYPQEMARIRHIAPDIPFLVPGVGAQGGRPEEVVRAGMMQNGYGLIINSSRGIIYADSGHDFAEAARKQTMALKDDINRYRNDLR